MKRAAVALLLDTLRLRDGLEPGAAASAWTAAECRGLLPLVCYEGAELWLYRRLQQAGVTPPEPFGSALRKAAHAATVSNMRVDAQTVEVLAVLQRAGFPCRLIKGQARRAAAATYPFADAKPVSDVDLLLPEDRVDQAWELLCATGYRATFGLPSPFNLSHHRPALSDSRGVSVELHLSTSKHLAPAIAWERATDRADQVTWDGHAVQVPNATELVWQALAHAVQDGAKGWRLRNFLDVAVVLATDPPVDWSAIAARIGAGEARTEEDGGPMPRDRPRRWLSGAAGMAGYVLPAAVATPEAMRLAPLLLWRGKVLNSGLGRAVEERLLEEGTRVEAGMPLSPGVPGTGPFRTLRRRSSLLVARTIYRAWQKG